MTMKEIKKNETYAVKQDIVNVKQVRFYQL